MAVIQSLITIVIFLAMLGILVVIHELGHFITARLAGVRVLEFGIGFPPRAKVLSSHGETLYTLNWLPIGGFVRLEGEDGDSDDPRSFVRAALPVKLIILLAGVAMNLILAFVIFTGIAWFPGQAWELEIGTIQPSSPAAAAGLMVGDAVVSVDGRYYDQFGGFQPLMTELQAHPGQAVDLGAVPATSTLAALPVTL